MKWKKYRLKTIEDAEDIIIATLYDCGIEGAEIEDKKPLTAEEKEQMFVDILPDMPDDDGVAYLDFYMDPEKEDTEALLSNVQKALDELRDSMDIGDGTIEESETEDKDWINNWKKYFRQFYVDDILITPSWEQVSEKDQDKMILHIDPGTAFGTGMHETTQLCIRQLRKYVRPGKEILDVGTGSGILAIVAVKLGAGHVLGTDLDPCAVPAVKDNKKANDIPDKAFDLMIGNMIGDKAVQDRAGYEKYDIVTANILADILVPMTPAVVPAMKKGGIYITSGILEDQAWKVLDACRDAGLEILEQTQQGEWVSVTARKPE
ncbi:MAG: 50S ribosomal protein L11 methyltransferase [Eubacterium sp.]|nr:50S ribosomal protein L11 methyltransferase [Eubacterium sp.]